jgi:hypothetical protein
MHIGKDLREIKLKKLMQSEGYEELNDLLDPISRLVAVRPALNRLKLFRFFEAPQAHLIAH